MAEPWEPEKGVMAACLSEPGFCRTGRRKPSSLPFPSSKDSPTQPLMLSSVRAHTRTHTHTHPQHPHGWPLRLDVRWVIGGCYGDCATRS